MRRLLRRLVVWAAASRPGKRLIALAVIDRPDLALIPLGWRLRADATLDAAATWPERLERFEDVAPLVLSSNQANRGVAAMRLDEAAHLFSAARAAGDRTIVEIGRERGGSTLLIAAALGAGASLHSYDPQTKLGTADPDREVTAALRRYGLLERVHLHVADSHTAPVPDDEIGLVLVDGDPTYEGTRLDFERFCLRLAPGGRALFHDAAPGGVRHAQLARLLDEIAGDADWERLPDVGTFADFRRR